MAKESETYEMRATARRDTFMAVVLATLFFSLWAAWYHQHKAHTDAVMDCVVDECDADLTPKTWSYCEQQVANR